MVNLRIIGVINLAAGRLERKSKSGTSQVMSKNEPAVQIGTVEY